MNATAKEYELADTSFANPHGLNNRANRSTAYDICKLGLFYYFYLILFINHSFNKLKI